MKTVFINEDKEEMSFNIDEEEMIDLIEQRLQEEGE